MWHVDTRTDTTLLLEALDCPSYADFTLHKAAATVTLSVWHHHRHFLPLSLTNSGPPADFPHQEFMAPPRSSHCCVNISDCLFLNPLLMSIKEKLNHCLIPSQKPRETLEGSGGILVMHTEPPTGGLQMHKPRNVPLSCWIKFLCTA